MKTLKESIFDEKEQLKNVEDNAILSLLKKFKKSKIGFVLPKKGTIFAVRNFDFIYNGMRLAISPDESKFENEKVKKLLARFCSFSFWIRFVQQYFIGEGL